ncbi:MAG: UDP-N-acetylmuramoyl-L-alanine--D-glutamate ligase, partial [Bacilli bacterium]|nr:UDP-N-acetylmuramoyl-L-alanine--D-glutamate ligase [Bacilli bacterium]
FIDDIKDEDIVVMETSCQQLENLDMFKPDIAVLTNISEAHLEFMKTYEHYTYVKGKIFNKQTGNEIAIINMGDNESLRLTKNIKATTKYFSSKSEINGCYIKDNAIYYYSDMVVLLSDIKLRGIHNYENIMAAIMVAKEFNVPNNIIKEVLSNFSGVEHRLEFVDDILGVKYYNDTEATNIKCTKIALSSFNENTILLLGGYERGQDFNELKDYCGNVKAIVGIGECRERVKQFGDSMSIKTVICEHLKEAFNECVKLSNSGDVVLLSPASASWDQYKQCEDRGDEFKNYVRQLSKKGDNE